jgi:hypothetical protein
VEEQIRKKKFDMIEELKYIQIELEDMPVSAR